MRLFKVMGLKMVTEKEEEANRILERIVGREEGGRLRSTNSEETNDAWHCRW